MGNTNQLNFVKQNVNMVKGPILEVGSKDYGNTPDFRTLFPDCEYVGVDMEEGKGVDFVLDLTRDHESIMAALGEKAEKKFNTAICFSVLEHCHNPFKMCENMAWLLNEKGTVFISVPFSWEIHAYPSDYWRFTPEGVKVLFPEFSFDGHPSDVSTNVLGDVEPITRYMMRAELSTKKGLKRKAYGRLSAFFIDRFKSLGIVPQVFRYPYLSPPVMVNMIGIKK